MAKSYEELEFTDNFMFMKVLTCYPDICRELVELILQVKVRSLKIIEYEKTMQHFYNSKGVRLDVYAEGIDDSCYDIEMQAEADIDIAKRSRYYHSTMDVDQLRKGQEYSALGKSFVIFICKEKIGDGYDKPVYTFRYRSNEDPDKYLEDETWTVFVNAQCDEQGLSDEMKEFLNFIRIGKSSKKKDSLSYRINSIVTEAKMDEKWSHEYMMYKLAEYDLTRKERENTKAEKARADAEKARADEAERKLAKYEEKYGKLDE